MRFLRLLAIISLLFSSSALADDWEVQRFSVGRNLVKIEAGEQGTYLLHKYVKTDPFTPQSMLEEHFMGVKVLRNGSESTIFKTEKRREAPSDIKIGGNGVYLFLPGWDEEVKEDLLHEGFRFEDFSIHASTIKHFPSNQIVYRGHVSFQPSGSREKDSLLPLWDSSEEGLFLVAPNRNGSSKIVFISEAGRQNPQTLYNIPDNFSEPLSSNLPRRVMQLGGFSSTTPYEWREWAEEAEEEEREFYDQLTSHLDKWEELQDELTERLIFSKSIVLPNEIYEKVRIYGEMFGDIYNLSLIPTPLNLSQSWLIERDVKSGLELLDRYQTENDTEGDENFSLFFSYYQWLNESAEIGKLIQRNFLRTTPIGPIENISVNGEGVYFSCRTGIFRFLLETNELTKVADGNVRWFEALENGGVLVLSGNVLFKWNPDGLPQILMSTEQNLVGISPGESGIFCIDDQIHYLPFDGEEEIIGDVEADGYSRPIMITIYENSVSLLYEHQADEIVSKVQQILRHEASSEAVDLLIERYRAGTVSREEILEFIKWDVGIRIIFHRESVAPIYSGHTIISRRHAIVRLLKELGGEEAFNMVLELLGPVPSRQADRSVPLPAPDALAFFRTLIEMDTSRAIDEIESRFESGENLSHEDGVQLMISASFYLRDRLSVAENYQNLLERSSDYKLADDWYGFTSQDWTGQWELWKLYLEMWTSENLIGDESSIIISTLLEEADDLWKSFGPEIQRLEREFNDLLLASGSEEDRRRVRIELERAIQQLAEDSRRINEDTAELFPSIRARVEEKINEKREGFHQAVERTFAFVERTWVEDELPPIEILQKLCELDPEEGLCVVPLRAQGNPREIEAALEILPGLPELPENKRDQILRFLISLVIGSDLFGDRALNTLFTLPLSDSYDDIVQLLSERSESELVEQLLIFGLADGRSEWTEFLLPFARNQLTNPESPYLLVSIRYLGRWGDSRSDLNLLLQRIDSQEERPALLMAMPELALRLLQALSIEDPEISEWETTLEEILQRISSLPSTPATQSAIAAILLGWEELREREN
ncbi:hypothetical protein ACFLRA_03300 [Bdellovibrionota bacterium]